ncbi:hypothetical protein BC939DRAFT_445592 [Gamsiella multidivaricata]|uniref:uncharacterized protein n=1 Tax=Gamsiella multidivaricata TaxID=101098 RepID=UPI0022210F54|nr:uncharacterized protein BC939DRAFT_445592 [Gamsiella multidivaricata]KAI7827033.1 hypothetical protein BC939DRAFT_445592 [Gamsiella multidivaricata]
MILIYYTTESICIGRSNWESPPRVFSGITTLKTGLSRNHCGLFHPQQDPSQSTGVRCGYGWSFIFLHLPLAVKHGDCVQALLLHQPRSQALVQEVVAGSRRFRDESWFRVPSRLSALHRPHQDRGSPRQHLYEECAHPILYRALDTAAKEGGATEEEAGSRESWPSWGQLIQQFMMKRYKRSTTSQSR